MFSDAAVKRARVCRGMALAAGGASGDSSASIILNILRRFG
jgi:hypothetical protein